MNCYQKVTATLFLRYSAMLIVPVLLFCFPLVLRSYHGPYFLGYNSDPAYAYLLNSLNIINGVSPGHTDHPGTTVQLLGAVALLARWIVYLATGGHLSVNEFVLRHPEEALRAINLLLNASIFVAIIYASLGIYRGKRTIGSVLIFQLSLLVPLTIKGSLLGVDAEPLLIFSVLVLSGLLARYQSSSTDPQDWFKMPFLMGVIMGFGLATKITFLPILIFGALFATARERFLVACGCVTSFLLFTLPIVTKYGKMFNWFKLVAIHKGTYGEGDVGVPAINVLIGNWLNMIREEPFLFIFLACYLAFLLASKYFANQFQIHKTLKILIIGCIVIVTQYLITIKHPGVYYMLPAIAMTPFLNVILIDSMKQHLKLNHQKIGTALLCVLVFIGILHGFKSTKAEALESRKYYTDETSLMKKINSFNDCSVTYYYRGSSIEYALAFGNDYASSNYNEELSRIYPDVIFYNIWHTFFYNYKGHLDPTMLNSFLNKKSTSVPTFAECYVATI